MNPTLKHNINLFAPLFVASFATYKLGFLKSKKVEQMAFLFLIVYLISWAIIASITKYALQQAQLQAIGTLPASTPNLNTDAIITPLHEDIYCIFCFRNYTLYEHLAALSDADMITVAKAYFAKYGANLGADVLGENSGIMHEALWGTLKDKFTLLNIK